MKIIFCEQFQPLMNSFIIFLRRGSLKMICGSIKRPYHFVKHLAPVFVVVQFIWIAVMVSSKYLQPRNNKPPECAIQIPAFRIVKTAFQTLLFPQAKVFPFVAALINARKVYIPYPQWVFLIHFVHFQILSVSYILQIHLQTYLVSLHFTSPLQTTSTHL